MKDKNIRLTIDHLKDGGDIGYYVKIDCPDCGHHVQISEFMSNDGCECKNWHLEIQVTAVSKPKPFTSK